MRTQSHYSGQVHSTVILLALAVTPVIRGIPTRLFSPANSLTAGSPPRNVPLPAISIIPEEEMELESLKGSRPAYVEAGAATKKSAPVDQSKPSAASTSSTTTTTSRPVAYVKKPENEETPALSDNANSLKYGGEAAEIEEALANLAHIPPGKGIPSLSVNLSGFKSNPLGGQLDNFLDSMEKRTSSRTLAGNNALGLLSRATGSNLEVDYTPQDIAEYIFWNGDERGVEMAINDFLQDGLVSPQDAIKFLEDVKGELSSLRNRYDAAVNLARVSSPNIEAKSMSRESMYRGSGYSGGSQGISKRQSKTLTSVLGSPYLLPISTEQGNLYSSATAGSARARGKDSLEDLDYEEIVEKLKQADTRVREYALEGVIYQLARELFTMGLQQSPGNSVPTFTSFIENLAVNGNIPKDLERSVLETLVQALVDAANERGLLNAKSEGVHSSSSAQPTQSQTPKKKAT